METIDKIIFKDIHNVISKIKKCSSKTTYSFLINELYALYSLCDDLEITNYPKIEDYSSKSIQYVNKEMNYAYEIFKNLDYHLNFSNNYLELDENKYLGASSYIQYFDSFKNIDLLMDFLDKYDKDLLKLFKEMVHEGRIFIADIAKKEEDNIYTPAFTTHTYGSYKPYIIIEGKNCINDLIFIAHELGHAKEYMNVATVSNKIQKQREYNCLSEVYSHYLQNLFILYLEKVGFNKKDMNTVKVEYNYVFYNYIKKLHESLINLKENYLLDYNTTDYLNYTYGIAISYHFIDRYLKDPEKTKSEVNNFIIFNGQHDMINMLEKFNLKDELINSKVLKKYL